ncbi:NtaA/DmoA family FMN-dependent monooxygenase [Nocardia sp. NPDC059246]|uniref:NtaA/DmoA family FMN-dependent monooxygenase n=1 Tax=unclassified Nocardia TaxID=2637762 RepID=UPI0036A8B91A
MSHTPFRIGYFSRFGPTAWSAADDRLHGDGWWTGDRHIALAQRLERAHVDFLFFDDTAAVSRAINDTLEWDLKLAVGSPRHDALALIPLLAKATEGLGFIATASTSFYPPYILSRTLSTVDSLTGGRAGWNVVTSGDDSAAQNHNYDVLPDHATRYEMADEFVEVAKALWGSFGEGALARDVTNNMYMDPAEIREIDHRGKHFTVRGPLNTVPSPQGTPVLFQAGASERGRDFAARHADCIFAPGFGIDYMKQMRRELRDRAAAHGRNPDEVKVFFGPPIQFTDGTPRPPATRAQVEYALLMISQAFNHDLTQYPLDQPFPLDIESRGSTALLEPLRETARAGKSLRQGVVDVWYRDDENALSGTPEQVAEEMMHIMDEVGGDGFLIGAIDFANQAFEDAVIDGVLPYLRAAGATRSAYKPAQTFRQALHDPDWTSSD